MLNSKMLMLGITRAEAHFENGGGSLIAITIRRKSPSKMIEEQPVEHAKLVDNKVVWASLREVLKLREFRLFLILNYVINLGYTFISTPYKMLHIKNRLVINKN
jgi:hypothetical protein